MRGLTHRWRLPASATPEVANPSTLAGEMTPAPRPPEPLAARVLRARGCVDPAAVAAFCDPRLSELHDPSLIPDLDRAAARILASLRADEPVVIYADYDVDGVTAGAILFHMTRAISPDARVSVYVPHRLEEGYGLNSAALQQFHRDGVRLVVSVDCGISAREPAAVAKGLGLDLIITDHHNPPAALEDLPDAFAVVHPRRPDSQYPFPDLSGAGVAFKLAWRLATLARGSDRVGDDLRDLLLDLLALASLGAIADVVPLVGENRVIARFGLARVKSTRFEGLDALIRAAGLAGENISAEHVGFSLAPRLNACGRMGHAREAVELLTTASGDRAVEIAAELTRLNDQRRAVERTIFEQACVHAEHAGMTRDDRRAIVLAHEEWHPGVVGIVCSRLVQRFSRPCILMQRKDASCHGSGRGVEGFSLHQGLVACAAHLETYGGHDMAAGLRLRESGLAAFTEAFTAYANERISPDQLFPSLRIDCDALLDELTPLAVEQLLRLGPFGPGNPSPVLRVRGLRVSRAPEAMGAHAKHMSVFVGQGARQLRLVGWSWGDRRSSIPAGSTIDVALKPKINNWNGRISVEGELCDALIVES